MAITIITSEKTEDNIKIRYESWLGFPDLKEGDIITYDKYNGENFKVLKNHLDDKILILESSPDFDKLYALEGLHLMLNNPKI